MCACAYKKKKKGLPGEAMALRLIKAITFILYAIVKKNVIMHFQLFDAPHFTLPLITFNKGKCSLPQ